MNIFNKIRDDIIIVGKQICYDIDLLSNSTIELSKGTFNGDIATNVAMLLAAKYNFSAKEIAINFKDLLSSKSYIASIEVAGPGFINFTLKAEVWHNMLEEILFDSKDFFYLNIGKGEKINIEYVSANPTGPLHVGHARGAVYGDVLARVLIFTGYDVTKEYYVNDAGDQIDRLAQAVLLRYNEICHKQKIDIPDGLYPGEYLIDVADKLFKKYSTTLFSLKPENCLEIVKEHSVAEMLSLIKSDLKDLGIEHDIFFSEKSLHENKKIDLVISILEKMNLIYDGTLPPPKSKQINSYLDSPKEKQKLFKSTDFGDAQDRSLQKSDGGWSYFASDLAYAKDKIDRGFKTLIYVLGGDHSGYSKRIQAIVNALSNNKVKVNVKICQIVNFVHDGNLVKMSKRAGSFNSVRDVIQEVGKDIIRFIMLTRKNDIPLDFDLLKVKELSKDNPIFYVQYAYVRTISILNKAQRSMLVVYEEFLNYRYNLSLLSTEEELELIKLLVFWPKVLEASAKYFEPHRIAFYLINLSSKFHTLWSFGKENNEYRFLIEDDTELTKARLGLASAVNKIIKVGFDVIGITPLDKM